MTDATFCPLYDRVVRDEPWKETRGAHRGLLFDKFGSAWRRKNNTLEFDKGSSGKKEGAGHWLRTMVGTVGDRARIEESCRRQRRLVESMGGRILLLKNSSRFVTGLGRAHPLENGFAWHHTLGTPYLPGSSLKGIVRAWYREELGARVLDDRSVEERQPDRRVRDLFGSQDEVGQFVLLDMLPTARPELTVDIMTPHYGPYYQDAKGTTPPGDWYSPVPISFLAVAAGQAWQMAILPRLAQDAIGDDQFDELSRMCLAALEWLGAGAKTSVGYGRFARDEQAESHARMAEVQRQSELAQRRALEAELDGLPADVAELVKRARKESWTADKSNNTRFLDGVTGYLEQHPSPSQACIEWIRDHCLELFWKGIWNDPDAMRGKKKDKYKHSSKRAREITHRLKKFAP